MAAPTITLDSTMEPKTDDESVATKESEAHKRGDQTKTWFLDQTERRDAELHKLHSALLARLRSADVIGAGISIFPSKPKPKAKGDEIAYHVFVHFAAATKDAHVLRVKLNGGVYICWGKNIRNDPDMEQKAINRIRETIKQHFRDIICAHPEDDDGECVRLEGNYKYVGKRFRNAKPIAIDEIMRALESLAKDASLSKR